MLLAKIEEESDKGSRKAAFPSCRAEDCVLELKEVGRSEYIYLEVGSAALCLEVASLLEVAPAYIRGKV